MKLALLLAAISTGASAADQRAEVLQAIFPGMEVVATSRYSRATPDAFAPEPIYQVNGPASNEIEKCASEDMLTQRFSKSREVRSLVFEWPRTPRDLVAVVQYRFIGANPAGSCWSVGMIVHLTRRGPGWELVERQLVEPQHHGSFASVQLLNLTGESSGELVVEPDFGGAATTGTYLQVFDLSGRRLRQILKTQSRLQYETEDFYSQVIDVPRSRQHAGKEICFELTVTVKNGKIFHRPQVSHECYPAGTGVDEKEEKSISDWLRPLKPQPNP